jgi:hypothetical protein
LSTNVDQLANNTVKVIYALLDPLLEALATDKFGDEAFMPVDEQHQRVLGYNENVVNGAFASWPDYLAPWKAWLRVFGLGNLPGGIPPDEPHERLQLPRWLFRSPPGGPIYSGLF